MTRDYQKSLGKTCTIRGKYRHYLLRAYSKAMGPNLILDNIIGVPLGSLDESVIIDTDYLLAVSSDYGAHPPRTRPAQFEMHLKTCAQKSTQFRQLTHSTRKMKRGAVKVVERVVAKSIVPVRSQF